MPIVAVAAPKVTIAVLALVLLFSTCITIPATEVLSYDGTIYNMQIDGKDAKVTIKPNKVKIVFKDESLTFVYDRDMSGGSFSKTDQEYLDKVFDAIEKFNKKNNTVNNFLKQIRKK